MTVQPGRGAALQAAERRGPRVSSFLWGFHVRHDGAVRFSETHKLTWLQSCQSGRRRRAVALASVRRSNCTCRFPAYSFHEDTRGREYEPSEGIRALRFTK